LTNPSVRDAFPLGNRAEFRPNFVDKKISRVILYIPAIYYPTRKKIDSTPGKRCIRFSTLLGFQPSRGESA